VSAGATQIVATIPFGATAGWHDVLVTNPDGSFSWFYGAFKGIEPADIAVNRPSRDMPRTFGSDVDIPLLLRNHPGDALTYRLDSAPAQSLAGPALQLTGLAYGWHSAT